jgi:hypothetical protein
LMAKTHSPRSALSARQRLDAATAMTFEDCAEAYIAAHRAGWRNPKRARCLVRARVRRTEVTDRNRDRDGRTPQHLTSTEETRRKAQTHRPRQACPRSVM